MEGTKSTKRRRRLTFNGFDVFVVLFCVIFAIICFFPLWYVLMVSITPMQEYIKNPVRFLPPANFDFQYYLTIFKNQAFTRSVFMSVLKTGFGTLSSVMITSMMAYAVSKRRVPGMRAINFLTILTMYFSGGLIPTYMLYRDIHILGTFWAMVLPMMMNMSYYIIMRNYFLHELSSELEEAAMLDGCTPVGVFFRIVLPTSAPMLAAITLFIAVFHWNDWYSFLTFVNVPVLRPLSNMLREVLMTQSLLNNMVTEAQASLGFKPPPIQLRMTTVIVATVPILIVYPFLQKYFTKGLMLGAVKG